MSTRIEGLLVRLDSQTGMGSVPLAGENGSERPKAWNSSGRTASSAPARGSSPDETTGSKRHVVLVVDDNDDVASLLELLLVKMGHQVHKASDGKQALQIAEKITPNVVLMDIGMPLMSGYEAAEKIREQDWGKSMVLVALSGWAREEDKQKSLDSGFDYHLIKPVRRAQLQDLMSSIGG